MEGMDCQNFEDRMAARFFEHRLRKEESFREKADYILANPVRAGLVERAEDWPYVFIAEPW